MNIVFVPLAVEVKPLRTLLVVPLEVGVKAYGPPPPTYVE